MERKTDPTAPHVVHEAEPPTASGLRRLLAGKKGKPFLILGLVALVVLAAIGGYLLLTAGQESTDDAQVEADVVPLSAQVGGRVAQMPVRENQGVKKGALVLVLDDVDYAARTRAAEAELASAQAQAEAADAQVQVATANAQGARSSARSALGGSTQAVSTADAQVRAARADVARARAQAHKAQLDLERMRTLAEKGSVSRQMLDDAQAAAETAQAQLQQAQAQLVAAQDARRVAESRVGEAQGRVTQATPAEAQIAIAEANAALAHARVEAAEAALALAQQALGYTQVQAPTDGVLSRVSVHPGQLVQAGQPIANLVPDVTYLLANFKETQVGRMRPGQAVKIELDAYPGREFEGEVESLSGGTGARFALLPPDNATGNFVKVVQRVPVRIRWKKPPDVPLRAGLSADVTVYVK